jgi:outer membrane protein assembly factor BamB
MMSRIVAILGIVIALAPIASPVQAQSNRDWLMFGGTPQRNMVNLVDKNIPTDWSVEKDKSKNIKWIVDLGDETLAEPVVANGMILIGGNNSHPRDPKLKGRRAVLLAFTEADGKFLWQIVHDVLPVGPVMYMSRFRGLFSTPVVEADSIFYVTPTAEVVCAGTNGKVVWKYDSAKELKVQPFDAAGCSPLIVGDLLMIATGHARDSFGPLPATTAPSFIALNKKTGKLIWKSSLPGKNIFEVQWANPALAVVDGKPQVIFPGGDGVLYSFEPETGKLIWKFDAILTRPKLGAAPVNYFIATPAVVGDKLYIGMGVAPELGTAPKSSYLFCVDLRKVGDVSPKSYDPADAANRDSALVWAYGGQIEPRPKIGPFVRFSSTLSTCAVHDGLVYAVEERGFLHCLDAKTGQRYWMDDLKTAVWSSPYCVDGKVLLACQDGAFFIYAHGKTKKQIASIDMEETVNSSPVVANGVLYIATRHRLIAVAEKK